MTTLSDTPGEGLAERLTRPIVGIENRTAQEVFDIMSDRIRRASPSVASATAALPSGYEGLVAILRAVEDDIASIAGERVPKKFPHTSYEIAAEALPKIREAIAALGRVRPVADDFRTIASNFWAFIQGEYGVRLSAEDYDDHNVAKFLSALATPPAPQPALALIEELTDEQLRHIAESRDVGTCRARIRTALAKGE